jgi:predicted molibdopterin-dependent oxidoreductase YjgC
VSRSPDVPLRIAGKITRPAPVTIEVDGRAVDAYPGETLAAALWAAGWRTLRFAPGGAEPRGAFCFMGACQECLLSVDGQRRPACQEPVRAGMVVETGRPA